MMLTYIMIKYEENMNFREEEKENKNNMIEQNTTTFLLREICKSYNYSSQSI